jgi:hypothetical protein
LKAVNATASFVLALVLALTAAVVIAAAVDAPPSLMSRDDRVAAMKAIQRDTLSALAACRGIEDDARRSLCRAQARADRQVALASLEARYRGTTAAQASIQGARARAAHSLDVARRLL